MIDPSHIWIERTKQDWDFWTYSMHSILAEIIKLGEVLRRNIQKGDARVLLHLFITALDGISQALSSISEGLHIVQAAIIRSLTDSEQNTNPSTMIVLYNAFEQIAVKIAPATGWITQAHPTDTRKRRAWIS